jgi:hypothetical protein
MLLLLILYVVPIFSQIVYIIVCSHPFPKVEPKGWGDNALKITLAYLH